MAPLSDPAPLLALILSGSGTLILALLGLSTRSRRRGAMPIAGLVLAASAAVALTQVRPSAITAGAGVAVLALGGTLGDLGLRSFPLRVATAFPGAWLIAFGAIPPGSAWIPWLIFSAIAVGAPLVADFGRGSPAAIWGAPLFAISAAGIYLTVPDTEEAAVLLAATTPVVLLGWPTRLARLGGAGSFATVGIAAWVIAWGGIGRETSLIGAAACLGLLVVEPLARLVTKRDTLIGRLSVGAPAFFVIGAMHFLVVMVASRVAGLRPNVPEACLFAFFALGAAFLVITVLNPTAVVKDLKDPVTEAPDPHARFRP